MRKVVPFGGTGRRAPSRSVAARPTGLYGFLEWPGDHAGDRRCLDAAVGISWMAG